MTIDDNALRDARVRLRAIRDAVVIPGDEITQLTRLQIRALAQESLNLLEEPSDTNSPDRFQAERAAGYRDISRLLVKTWVELFPNWEYVDPFKAVDIMESEIRTLRTKAQQANVIGACDPDTNSPAGDTFTPATNIPQCSIQLGCAFPEGHMGNCGGSLIWPRDPHKWTDDKPEAFHSGKLTYYICPRCHCVEEHLVHGWKPPEPTMVKEETDDEEVFREYYNECIHPTVVPESVDFLLSRICSIIPEPSLMDIEEGGQSQTLLLLRAQTIAQLHQAKQLDRIATMMDLKGRRHSFQPTLDGDLHRCAFCMLERTHPVHG